MKKEKNLKWKIQDMMTTVLQTKENSGEKKEHSAKRKIASKKIQNGRISIKDINFFLFGIDIISKGTRSLIDTLQQNMVNGDVDVTNARIMLAELKKVLVLVLSS